MATKADSKILPATDPHEALASGEAALLVMRLQAISPLCFRNFLCPYNCLSILCYLFLCSCLASYFLDFLYSWNCILYSNLSLVANYFPYSSSSGGDCCTDWANQCIDVAVATTATDNSSYSPKSSAADSYCIHSFEIHLCKEHMAKTVALAFS